MLFGNSTEPSYAGIRVPRLYSGDDAVLTRQVSPQERYRQYNGASRTEAEQRRLDQVLEDKEKEAPRNGKLQGAIQGLGGSLAEIFAQNDQRQPLSLPPVNMGEQIPIIDPRWLPRRENGGPVKKNRPYLVGEDGPEVIVPEDDGTVIPNGRRSVDWDLKEILTPQEETVTETVTETPEPSTADMLRGQVNDIQRRLAKGATKNPDGTTTYGDKQYRKRNALDVLKSAGLGVLQSLASAPPTNDLGALLGRAIGGGAAGGVMGATMNNADEKMADRMKLAQILPQYQQAYGIERQEKADKAALLNAASLRNQREQKTLAQERADVLKIVNASPDFDPTDPENAELVVAMQKVGLPIAPRNAKSKVKYITDAKTGQVYADIFDEAGGRKLVRLMNDDDTPFTATTPQMMTAADRAEQRKLQKEIAENRNLTSIKVAQIGADSRANVANINQGGATARTELKTIYEAKMALVAIDAAVKPAELTDAQWDERKKAAKAGLLAQFPQLK